MFDDFVRAWGWSGRKPLSDRTFDFWEAVEAFRCLKSGRHMGKRVVRIW